MEKAIEVEGLCKTFGGKTVLREVCLSVQRGEIYAFLGANGAGKTTLMKLLFCILKADAGRIHLLGQPVHSAATNPVFGKIGSIIETPVFYRGHTASENLALHCAYMGIPQMQKEIGAMLHTVGLDDVGQKRVGEFSLGMKQRLALGRALLGNPELLVLDEPINGLDPMGISDTRDLLLRVREQYGTAMLISSHIISEIDKIADTVGIIEDGVMLAQGSLSAIKKESASLEEYFKLVVLEGRKAC